MGLPVSCRQIAMRCCLSTLNLWPAAQSTGYTACLVAGGAFGIEASEVWRVFTLKPWKGSLAVGCGIDGTSRGAGL